MDGPGDGADRVTVRVLPAGITFTGVPGTTLLDAARRAGLSWPTICGGAGDCTTCYVQVVDHPEHLGSMTAKEHDGLELVRRRHPGAGDGELRLACQARLGGDLTVTKRGVRHRGPAGSGS